MSECAIRSNSRVAIGWEMGRVRGIWTVRAHWQWWMLALKYSISVFPSFCSHFIYLSISYSEWNWGCFCAVRLASGHGGGCWRSAPPLHPSAPHYRGLLQMDIGFYQSASNNAGKAPTVAPGVTWHTPPQSWCGNCAAAELAPKMAPPRLDGASVCQDLPPHAWHQCKVQKWGWFLDSSIKNAL